MRGIGVYIIIVFAVICIWYWLSAGATSNSYTQSQFEKDLDKNQVKSVKVVQNREIPTGSLEVKFKDGTSKVLYVSDVNNIEKGRIIEVPVTSLEQDTRNILTGNK